MSILAMVYVLHAHLYAYLIILSSFLVYIYTPVGPPENRNGASSYYNRNGILAVSIVLALGLVLSGVLVISTIYFEMYVCHQDFRMGIVACRSW